MAKMGIKEEPFKILTPNNDKPTKNEKQYHPKLKTSKIIAAEPNKKRKKQRHSLYPIL